MHVRQKEAQAGGSAGRAEASAGGRRFSQGSGDSERSSSRFFKLAFWATSLTWLAWGVFSKHLTS